MSITLQPVTEASNKLSAIDANFTEIANVLNATFTSIISNANSKSAIIRYGVALATGVGVGDLVYFDSANGHMAKALAALAAPADNGSSVEAESARVIGMVIDVDSSHILPVSDTTESGAGTTGTIGTVLCGGFYKSAVCAAACLGEEAQSGTYYLSADTPGKAVTVDKIGGRLQQPVLTYFGDGAFSLNTFYMAHDNHFHSYAEIKANALIDTEETDAASGYTLYRANLPKGFGTVSGNLTAVFAAGAFISSSSISYGVDSDTAYITIPLEAPTDVTIFNHYPFAYGSPVVREVVADKDSRFSVETKNGTATLKEDTYTVVAGGESAVAVSSINGGTITTTPVVAALRGGAGVIIQEDGSKKGVHTVSLASIVDNRFAPDIINYNGAVYSSDGVYSFIQLTSGTSSNIVIQKSIYNIKAEDALSFKVFAEFLTESNAGISVKSWFLPFPDNGSTEEKPALTNLSSGTINVAAGTVKKPVFIAGECELAIGITGAGTMFAEISNTGTETINIHRLGFLIA